MKLQRKSLSHPKLLKKGRTSNLCCAVINTVLGQKKCSQVRPRNFTNSQPISLIFQLETRYISHFLWKKIWGAPPKITPHFLDFSKRTRSQKTRFFPVGRNFEDRFLKKGPKSSIFGVPELENFFDKLSIKKLRHTKNFVRGLRIDILNHIFKKVIFRFFLSDFCCNLQKCTWKD